MKSSKKGMILAIVLIAITIIATGSFITVKAYGSITVKKNMELGNKYLQEGKYDEAILAFEKVISIDAKNEQANNRLGLIKNYQQIERLYATEDYKAALELISKTKVVEGFKLIETVVADINKNAESKLQIMKEIDNLSNVVEKLIGEKKFAEAVSLVNKYSDKDLNDEYKQKLEDLRSKINKAKSDSEAEQKKLAEESKRKEEEEKKLEEEKERKRKEEEAKRNIGQEVSDSELISLIKGESDLFYAFATDPYESGEYNNEYGELSSKYNSESKIINAFKPYATTRHAKKVMELLGFKFRDGVASINLGDGTPSDYTNSKVIKREIKGEVLLVTITEEFMGDKQEGIYRFVYENGILLRDWDM